MECNFNFIPQGKMWGSVGHDGAVTYFDLSECKRAADSGDKLAGFVFALITAEREACAKVCEAHAAEVWDQEGGALNCADKIRARKDCLTAPTPIQPRP